ncbi:hypothetical protein Tco_1091984 [Tanacetum coccineum]|uniref:Uncharacterized protein n=1 Tax=Tanacetum coccineum TaxID=301880 RepID=A0ABQ5I8I3_9ASTR
MENPEQAFVEYASSRTGKEGGPNRDDEGIEWIKKGDLRNLKIPCMIGHKFMANAYIEVDLPMNIMSLAYYNSIRKNGYEYRGRNFVGLGRDMHVFFRNMSYVMDFTILENIETNIDPNLSNVVFGWPFVKISCLAINRKYGLMTFIDGIKEITSKMPYKDPERSELSSEGHDLLSSRTILSEDDYDRGCRKPSDLEDRFYKDTIKLGPEYVTRMDDEGEVRIRQKLQENRQKWANTDTGIRRAQKKPRIQSRSQEKSTMVKLQSKKVKPWSTEVNH